MMMIRVSYDYDDDTDDDNDHKNDSYTAAGAAPDAGGVVVPVCVVVDLLSPLEYLS